MFSKLDTLSIKKVETPKEVVKLNTQEPKEVFMTTVKQEEKKVVKSENIKDIFSWKLEEERKVIWCYNSYTKTSRSIYDTDEEGCYKWWDHNIMVMPISHLSIWRELWDDAQIINRMPIVNFESWYDIYAENPFAKWYVQTLKKWNIDINIKPQLDWMDNRQKYQLVEKTPAWSTRCWTYWTQYNYKDWFSAWEEWVMACLYRYHYHAINWTWYAKKAMSSREIYMQYFYNN